MVFNSMQFLRKVILQQEKIISNLEEIEEEIQEFWPYKGIDKAEIQEKIKKLKKDSFHHQEILNYWIEQINAGEKI